MLFETDKKSKVDELRKQLNEDDREIEDLESELEDAKNRIESQKTDQLKCPIEQNDAWTDQIQGIVAKSNFETRKLGQNCAKLAKIQLAKIASELHIRLRNLSKMNFSN